MQEQNTTPRESPDPPFRGTLESIEGALNRRIAERFMHTGRLRWCSRCMWPVIVFADGRKLAWPSLDHHDNCIDVADEVQIKPAPSHREKTAAPDPERRGSHRPRTLGTPR